MDDFKLKLAEAQDLFHDAMEKGILAVEVSNLERVSKLSGEQLDGEIEKLKTRLTEKEGEFADDAISVMEKNCLDDADQYEALSKLYFKMGRKFHDVSHNYSEFEMTFYEKCLQYNDLYKKTKPNDPELVFGVDWHGDVVLECDVLALLFFYYAKLNHKDKLDAERLDNSFAYYVDKHGKNSRDYIPRLCNILKNIEKTPLRLPFIEKWADANSTDKRYGFVWHKAAEYVLSDDPQTLEEHMSQVRRIGVFLERAALLDPVYTEELKKWRNDHEKQLRQNGIEI